MAATLSGSCCLSCGTAGDRDQAGWGEAAQQPRHARAAGLQGRAIRRGDQVQVRLSSGGKPKPSSLPRLLLPTHTECAADRCELRGCGSSHSLQRFASSLPRPMTADNLSVCFAPRCRLTLRARACIRRDSELRFVEMFEELCSEMASYTLSNPVRGATHTKRVRVHGCCGLGPRRTPGPPPPPPPAVHVGPPGDRFKLPETTK